MYYGGTAIKNMEENKKIMAKYGLEKYMRLSQVLTDGNINGALVDVDSMPVEVFNRYTEKIKDKGENEVKNPSENHNSTSSTSTRSYPYNIGNPSEKTYGGNEVYTGDPLSALILNRNDEYDEGRD